MSGPDSIRWGDLPPGFNAEASDRSAQVIQIDNGKSVAAIGICAVICGICMAVTVGTVWHSKDREIATEAQLRKTQNHEDELTAQVKYLTKLLENRNVTTRR
jgi:hypothetical protein